MTKVMICIAAMMIMCSMTPCESLADFDRIEVNHLSVNNTLVRVYSDRHYLLLPVQESSDDARINVLVDGNIAETIYVRLAKTKIDYIVPFDLTLYKGKHLALDILTPQSRSSVREAKDDVCWKDLKLADSFDTDNRERFRPSYHHTPLYGWMNDPNGMFYKDGQWHLYYQYNPYGSKWQNMTWGHSISSDLVHWTHKPLAIKPNGLGTVFSGSCVVDENNTSGFGKDAVIAMYTSAGTSQMQSLAWSTDNGTTFDIYTGSPTITLESEARDPNMFWNNKTNEWNLVLAHPLDHEMLFFSSHDLKRWTLQSSFGQGTGAQDGIWECPDIFELPVENSDEKKWVLISNINPGGPFGGSATQYFIGNFNGRKFIPDTDADGNVPTKWLDFGKDHYATVSWSNAPEDRRVVIGWMSNWQYAADVPTTQFRSANTLPRDMSLFRAADGQIYASCQPSPETLNLRGAISSKINRSNIGKKQRSFPLPKANNGICEIVFDIDSRKAEEITITLANNSGEEVPMKYNPQKHTFSFDRTKSGIVDFSKNFTATTIAPTFENEGIISIRIFIDRSSIEIFGNDGKFVMTNLVFPEKPYSTISFSSEGGNARLSDMKIYSINAQ